VKTLHVRFTHSELVSRVRIVAGYRYCYLGDRLTDDRLRGEACNPVLRPDGKCIVGRSMATQLVLFRGETRPRVVLRRMLRVVWR
jgi:hypothetical protein